MLALISGRIILHNFCLTIFSGMSLTQVSTWFANARRRLKKESGSKEDTSDDSMDGKGSQYYFYLFLRDLLDDTADESALSVVDVEPTVHVTPSLARERESKQEEATESKEEEPEDRSPSSTPPLTSESSNSTSKPKIWRIVDHIQND
jgi:hypothetical protein